jgi:NTE family protein
VTGEPVVLNKGSLAMSMRASMAIPSVFTPVRIDGNLLVDGGLLRNMPVQEVLDMGADIVIGVFVSSDLDPEEKLNSAVSILSQSAFIKSAFDSRAQMEKCDIAHHPRS